MAVSVRASGLICSRESYAVAVEAARDARAAVFGFAMDVVGHRSAFMRR